MISRHELAKHGFDESEIAQLQADMLAERIVSVTKGGTPQQAAAALRKQIPSPSVVADIEEHVQKDLMAVSRIVYRQEDWQAVCTLEAARSFQDELQLAIARTEKSGATAIGGRGWVVVVVSGLGKIN